MGTKEYNKVILQTSITSLDGIYSLLQAVKENQPMTSQDGKNTIFPQARAQVSKQKGGIWEPENRDTHAELTLREMGFLRYIDDETFEVSDLGNDFLEAFELEESDDLSNPGTKIIKLKDKLPLNERNQLLFDILERIAVKKSKYDRNIRPYMILFRLLTDGALKGFISKSEWACFSNTPSFIKDDQYDEIKERLLEVRQKDEKIDPQKSDRTLTKLVQWGVLDNYTDETHKANCYQLNAEFARVLKNNMLPQQDISSKEKKPVLMMNKDQIDSYVKNYDQTIFYGVPGCGKSTELKKTLRLNGIESKDTIRIVFHPDYSIADFIGQILPEMENEKDLKYDFKPGPFTKILYDAYFNPSKKYALIIEEINRGNAAAIFGEIFQLLDRKKEKSKEQADENSLFDEYGEGWSEFPIYNENIQTYIGLEDGVRLPPNLAIYATMNTSDQNVFTLDNAFQRRWNMELVPNKIAEEQYSAPIEKMNVCWGIFVETFNKKIIEIAAETGLSSLEDKRLGAWFVVADANRKISQKDFSCKVLKYLWDDAFRMDRTSIFKDCRGKPFEDVVDDYKNEKQIFTDDLVNELNIKQAEFIKKITAKDNT